ncbi:polyprenyl synthetase family protein [Lederbergia lenta]|uniref:polyprenyl synthetase family protein n=1 Tax=Lederbergia lenta TaxID=1467 RepID=UPI00203BF7DB|nr:farnesyl diphosphate synthase [Lederbergia lenta]MCM3111480.1 polyprenyl synthetase family protein [Lederbergia lenta]
MEEFSNRYKTLLDRSLLSAISKLEAPDVLKEAMIYSLKAGGKRIRPLLLFSTITAFEKDPERGLAAAVSLEMIHTYSLVHDDLPSMDDDDLRRGKPTNHMVFGEAIAILAGDGLLTHGFQLIADDNHLSDQIKVKLISLLAKCAGPEGMVSGQILDIQGENKKMDIVELEYIHRHKTGKLLSFSVLAGAIIAGANDKQLALFEKFSQHLGLAFQISDDILDIEGSEQVIGKPVGSDTGKTKSTYPAILTIQGAREHLSYHIEEAKNTLKEIDLHTSILEKMTDLIETRDH